VVSTASALRQAAVVPGAQKVVDRMRQGVGALHQFENVRFTVRDIDQPRGWQVPGPLRQPLVALDPAPALHRVKRPRPHPGVEDTQRQALRRHCVGRVQVHAALCRVGQTAQPIDGLPVEIQFGRVLQAQDDRVLGHAGLGTRHVRGQHRLPTQPPFRCARLIQKPIGCLRLRTPIAGARNARRRCITEPIRQLDQALGQAFVTYLSLAKLVHCPSLLVIHDHAPIDRGLGATQVYQTDL
jgi:hypothetical protein